MDNKDDFELNENVNLYESLDDDKNIKEMQKNAESEISDEIDVAAIAPDVLINQDLSDDNVREKNNDKKSKSKIIYDIILIILICVFLVSGYMVFDYFYNSKKEDDRFNEIANVVNQALGDDDTSSDNSDIDTLSKDESSKPEKSEETKETEQDRLNKAYNQLHEQNSDMVGWIRIEGTKVNYPVMYTPDDEEFYIKRDFDKNYSSSGVVFAGAGAEFDPNSDNIVLYGHHMRDGTMFADVINYGRDLSYIDDHKYIEFDTLNGFGTYEVYAVYSIDVSVDNGHFEFYNFINAYNENIFNDFVSKTRANSIYKPDIQPKFGDEFITLVTCDYSSVNGRLVVVARKVSGNEYKPTTDEENTTE